MDSIKKLWIAVVAVAIIALVGWFQPVAQGILAGTTNYDALDVTDGYSVDGTTVIDGSGNVDGPITSTTGTFTDDVGVGTTSPSNELHVEGSATSTVTVSSDSASSGGRIILEDSDGAGCSEIYILDGTVISATVTCPTGI